MATVKNLNNVNPIVDPEYCTYNRTNAGEPNGSLTPEFVGELVLDTTNNILWKALSSANSSWVALTGPST